MRKILCVDDNVQMLYLIREFLTRAGFDILVAENGVMALDHFLTNFDTGVVVTDIEMPEMDGNTLARKIRDSARKGITVIAVTGSHDADIEASLFNHILKKPFDLRELEALCYRHSKEKEPRAARYRLVEPFDSTL